MDDSHRSLKRCSACGELKPRDCFHRRSSSKDGLVGRCKDCVSAYCRRWYENRETVATEREERERLAAERHRAGRRECVDCGDVKGLSAFERHAYSKDGYRGQCVDCYASAKLRSKFNITLDQYNHLLYEVQGGKCANPGCDARPKEGARRFPVDHDHACCPDRAVSCGKCVRAILCPPCNTTLGQMRDSPKRLRGLADFVENHHTQYALRFWGVDDWRELLVKSLIELN
ncbi:endonuclease VII [Mycobacterium phage Omega]|uniref:Recombination endonuclease VII n=1 Tax=Mycobacterium phage Omega TaxID=2907835 RepID=Q853W7_BPMOM|nr:endonuclease VII [Mycobacterium phage Omega]AAN12841.1 hypothetical protein PBI_OMEGA_199 [Mycobacterium phage Omega]